MTDESTPLSFPTSIGSSTPTTMSLLGHDMATEMLGQVGFSELCLWLMTGQRPDAGQVPVFDAVMVALADHGLTPIAIASRLTYYSAPDSIQGALAAGLLGGGSRFLGVTEDTGRFLAQALAGAESTPVDDADFDALALAALRTARAAHVLVPGLGHPVHKDGDPRTPVIIRIAAESGHRGPQLRLFEAIGRMHPQVLGRTLPLNGAGVCGAALADIGVPVELLRGAVLIARCAGLLGHLREEMQRPLGESIYMAVDRNAEYRPEEK
ncbi:citryl-CoA lyase [Glutamicibacter protophormiae]|uniref:citryl-CoA lyase n=1 Tax=Glutamicibacter protophormiae TaxID=37930 RepID=UPI003A925FAC